MKKIEISPSYRLTKLVESLAFGLEKYREKGGKNEYIIKEKEHLIGELLAICADVAELEPVGLLSDISRIIRRNTLLGVDITAILIPNREKIPPYPYANVVIADLSGANIPDSLALWEYHRDGRGCVEVDDLTGNQINDPLAMYANRGDLYVDEKKRKEAQNDTPANLR